MLYSLLALLPIGVLALWKNLNVAVTAALFFYWQAPASHFFASLLSALVSSISILMIVSGAMFLYQVMEGRPLAGTRPATVRRFAGQCQLPVQHHCRRRGSQPY